jgi:hypothetical protein
MEKVRGVDRIRVDLNLSSVGQMLKWKQAAGYQPGVRESGAEDLNVGVTSM